MTSGLHLTLIDDKSGGRVNKYTPTGHEEASAGEATNLDTLVFSNGVLAVTMAEASSR